MNFRSPVRLRCRRDWRCVSCWRRHALPPQSWPFERHPDSFWSIDSSDRSVPWNWRQHLYLDGRNPCRWTRTTNVTCRWMRNEMRWVTNLSSHLTLTKSSNVRMGWGSVLQIVLGHIVQIKVRDLILKINAQKPRPVIMTREIELDMRGS